MSIDLSVAHTKPLAINLLLYDAAAALQQILCLHQSPEIFAEELRCGEVSELKLDFLPTDSQPAIHVRIAREPEIAQISTIHSSSGDIIRFISMGSQRTALEYALGAAVAVAIARNQQGMIKDQALFFSPRLERSASDFSDALNVSKAFSDYREAAKEFARKLKMSECVDDGIDNIR
jgi:hypothetical protein